MVIATEMPGEMNNYNRFGSETNIIEDDEIPISAKNRQPTDKYFLIVFVVCLLSLIPLTTYTLYFSDVNRLLYGYDECGNVCGELNVKYSQWSCTGMDMRDKPIYMNGKCVADVGTGESSISRDTLFNPSTRHTISDYEENDYDDRIPLHSELTISTKDEHEENFLSYIRRVIWKLATACFFSIVLCQGMVLLFRYATAMIVWTIAIASWLLMLGLCITLWSFTGKGDKNNAIVPAIALSIVVLVLLCIMVFMRKSIRLVIMLLKESSKAVFDMPTTFYIPFMAITGGIIICAVCGVVTTYMFSSGKLVELYNGHLTYSLDGGMIASIIINFIMTLWTLEFIYGIQYMIISGAISKWYFTRDKSLLQSPIRVSSYITFKFHLGTIAVGSFILTLVTILRITLRALARNPRIRIIIDFCMSYLEAILRFFTTNAYIFTAMHGTPFYTSGKKVAGLLKMNICNVMALTGIGEFVLRMAQVFLMLISGFATAYVFLGGEDADDNYYYCIVGVVIITGIFSFTILGTIETAVDAMFVCFCEDCGMNDGVTKPYFMTRGLMEFVENSKVVFASKIQKKGLPTI